MIISFAWTVEALLAGRKTCTRRQWKQKYTRAWRRAWVTGRLVHEAWDLAPFAGGKQIAQIRLTCEPYQEALRDMPEEDLLAEGGYWETREEFWELFGGDSDTVVTVVRFEVVPGAVSLDD